MKTIGCAALVAAMGFGGLAGSASARQDSKKEQETKKAPAPALKSTPEERLAQAKLVADGEHDPERALALLAALANDASVQSEVRGQALLAAARCLNQLGREEEARAKLQAAAQLKGAAADEAKHLLDGGFADQQLELRIAKAIEELFASTNPSLSNSDWISQLRTSRTASDLVWVGGPAVPRLALVLADADHLIKVTGAAYLLGRINNDAAAIAIREAVRRSDPFYKRAILAGFPNSDGVGREPMRTAIMTLLQDPDPRVKQWVLSGAEYLETDAEVLPLTRDPDDAVKIAAWSAIHGWKGTSDADFEEELVRELRRCLKEDRDEVRRVAVDRFRERSRLLERDSGRALFVETLLDPVLTKATDDYHPAWMWTAPQSTQHFDRPVALDLIVRVATTLGRRGHQETDRWISEGDNRHMALEMVLRKSAEAGSQSQPGAHTGWPTEERSKSWALVRLGYGPTLSTWIAANATGDDLAAVAESGVACGEVATLTSVMNVVTGVGQPDSKPRLVLSAEQKTAIVKSVLTLFQSDVANADVTTPKWAGRAGSIAHLLIRLGTDEGDRALVRALVTTPEPNLVTSLLIRSELPVDAHVLVDLVTIPSNRGTGQEERARNDALGRIAASHLPELTAILPRCYELGLDAESVPGPRKRSYVPRGFAWLVARDSAADDDTEASSSTAEGRVQRPQPSPQRRLHAEWSPVYSETELRAAFEACSKGTGPGFWADVVTVLEILPQEGPFDPVATALLDLVGSKVATITDGDDGPAKGVKRKNLVQELLRHRWPHWKQFALANCLEGEVGETIVRSLPELTPELLEKVMKSRAPETADSRRHLAFALRAERDEALRARAAGFLDDPSGQVRAAAIGTVLVTAPDRALDLLLPLAKDPDAAVRTSLCAGLATTFDRRVIPVLVDGLQDRDESSREAAKKSLDSIQYVFEQKEKWKQMLEGAGLDSSNAAEALVKQAAATEPKPKRLIAIESLGTLGVAETLPVLINFMNDSDAEIAAAAKAAVERINRRASEKESAPAEKKPQKKEE